MFSYFGNQYCCLAFRTDSHEFARQAVHDFAETTLNAWLQGQERAYAVRDVLREVRAVFGHGGAGAADLIEQALLVREDARPPLVTEAVQLLARQLRGNPAQME